MEGFPANDNRGVGSGRTGGRASERSHFFHGGACETCETCEHRRQVRYPALDGVISHVRQIQAVAALQLLCFRG